MTKLNDKVIFVINCHNRCKSLVVKLLVISSLVKLDLMKAQLPPIQIVIESILTKLGFTDARVFIEASSIPGHVVYNIQVSDSALLIGRGGQNLQALSRLVRDIIMNKKLSKRYDTENFIVDVNNYQESEVQKLITEVENALQSLQSIDSNQINLPPMSSFNRRVVHAYLADKAGYTTQSRGDGPDRHIVVSIG